MKEAKFREKHDNIVSISKPKTLSLFC